VSDAAIDPLALAIIAGTPDMARRLFADLPADAVAEAGEGGWSPRTALAHLVDTHDGVIALRIRRIIDEDRPFIRSIDPEGRLAEGGFAGRTVASLLDELQRLRDRDVPWLRSLRAEQLARAGDHDEAGEITANDLVHQWAYHDLMHLQQIAAMLQARLARSMGNTRKFYDV